MKQQLYHILVFLFCFGSIVHAKEKRLNVVATTSFLADIAQNIAKEQADVISLMPIGGDPHVYEPVPEDADKIVRADLIFKNGLTLEGWLDEMINHAGTKAQIITVSQGVQAIQSAEHAGAYDPHAWMDVQNALIYAQNIYQALATADPRHQPQYLQNYENYRAELDRLDRYIREKVADIPEPQRIIVTSHDAFRYFGNRYGFRVESVLGTSTDADVRFEDIQHLITVVDKLKVPAIFVESTINPKMMQQISRDKGVKVGGKLFADSLGDEESGADTYIHMLTHNINTLVSALSQPFEEVKQTKTTDYTFIFVIVGLFALAFGFVYAKLSRTNSLKLDWQNFRLKVENLTVAYDRKPILSNVYLQVENGFVYGLIGGNGSGKSTLMKTIVGLLKPQTGNISLHGHKIAQVKNAIAYIPQKEEIDWHFPARVIDVVQMGLYPVKGVFEGFNAADKATCMQALTEMGIADLAYRQIGELSGGQQQRVFIARALCQSAEVYLLDEPFVGVDALTELKIMELMKKLAASGKMVIIIHHDLSKVRDYFDRLIMVNRRIVAVGDTNQVFTEANIQQTYGGSLPILHRVQHEQG